MKIIQQVELIAAAPNTVPPRLKITLKLTEIPKAAIADRKSTRLNSSHMPKSRMPSSA